ncbi:MAG: class I SAM-dependent methyltransferase [Planctomycetota bacterium]
MNRPLNSGYRESLKANLKSVLGSSLARFNRVRTIGNYRRPSSESGRLDRLILHYLRKRCSLEERNGFLERLHAAFWQGDSSRAFYENCDKRFDTLFIARQRDDFLRLKEICEAQPRFKRLVEIGTGSGRLLEYLYSNIKGFKSAIGLDLNEDVIQTNRRRNDSPAIEYVAGDAVKWVTNNVRPGTAYISNGGVLEYFSRATLNQMLTTLKRAPLLFYASEPVASDHHEDDNRSHPFGDELSFSHNYRDIFLSNGYRIHHQSSTKFVAACSTEYRMVTTIASWP